MKVKKRLKGWAAAAVVTVAGLGGVKAQQPKDKAVTQAVPACHEAREKIVFGVNSTSFDKGKVEEAATWLAGDKSRTVVIKASTDKSGNARYNEELSFRRAEAVGHELIGRGIDPDRIVAVGQGEVGAGDPAEQRAAVMLLCAAPASSTTARVAPPTPPSGAPVPAAMRTGEPSGPGSVAQATPPPPSPEPYAEAEVYVPRAEAPPSTATAIGLGLSVGGGVVGFTDDEVRDLVDVGGSWDVRLILGARWPLAIELAYVGSAQSIYVAGISTNSFVVGHGLESLLRVQLPLYAVRPYLFGGLGWTNYGLVNTGGNQSLLLGSDDVLTLPAGIGLTMRPRGGFIVDVRAALRLAYGDDLMQFYYGGADVDARLHSWLASARLGWEF